MPSTYDPVLFLIEDRGYGRGVGHCILPSGQLVAASHEEPNLELNNEFLRVTYGEWMKELG